MPTPSLPVKQGSPTDAYSGANAVLERQRAALLASMTQRMQDVAGTYQGAGQQAGAAQQAAIAQINTDASHRGVPAAAQAEVQRIASQPYVEAGAYRSALAQGRDQYLHTAATANDAYNREAGQAVPVLRAQTEQQRQQKYQQILQEQDAARHAEEIRVAAEKRQTAHETLQDFLTATHYQTQDRIAQQALDAQIQGMLHQEQQGQGLLDAQNAAAAAGTTNPSSGLGKGQPSPGPYGPHGLTLPLELIANDVGKKFGISSYGGYRAEDGYGEHSTHRAVDFMVGNNKSKGASLLAYAVRLPGVQWAIWDHRIYYPNGSSKGLADRGSPTANHEDHVHVFWS